MTHLDIEYYFSKKALFFGTLLLAAPATVFSFFIIISYKDNLPIAIIFSLLLIFILALGLPKYLLFLFSAITGRPAVIITKNVLIDNVNRHEYKWSDIKQITYKAHKGRTPGGYTAIILKNEDKVIQIPHNSIKCKTTEFLNDLIEYHKKYQADT